MPLPKPITNEVIDLLRAMKLPLSAMDKKRAEREIDKLKKSSASEAWACEGILRSLESDVDGVRDSFEKSLRLQPSSRVTYINYGHALLLLGYPSEAVAQFKKAVGLADDVDPESGHSINLDYEFLASLVLSGAFIEASSTMPVLFSNNPDLATEGFSLTDLERIAERMKRNALSDDDMHFYADASVQVMRKHGLQDLEPALVLHSYGSHPQDEISLAWKVCDRASVSELNIQLAEILAEMPIPVNALQKITVSFERN